MTRQINDIEAWTFLAPSEVTDSQFSKVKENLIEKWGSYEIEISPSAMVSFTLSDWREFQDLLKKMSEDSEVGYYDTAEKLGSVLRETISDIENSTKSIPQLLACVGTLAKLSYSEVQSGESYGWTFEEKSLDLELEQEFVKTLAPIITGLAPENITGDVFDGLDLLSDMGRFKFLMFYFYHDECEIPQVFFDNWAPSVNHTSNDLTSVLLAAGKFTLMAADIGWKEVYAKIDSGEISYNLENAKINPRFLHFFVDESRMSLPWWMELSTWHEFHSLVEGFDKLTGYWGEFADPKILLSLFETALMPENFSVDDSEDRSYFENAIDFLREVVEQ